MTREQKIAHLILHGWEPSRRFSTIFQPQLARREGARAFLVEYAFVITERVPSSRWYLYEWLAKTVPIHWNQIRDDLIDMACEETK